MNTPDLPADLRPLLESGLVRLGLEPALATPLLAYLALLVRWNKTYNLTAVRDPHEIAVTTLASGIVHGAVGRVRTVRLEYTCRQRVDTPAHRGAGASLHGNNGRDSHRRGQREQHDQGLAHRNSIWVKS